MGRGHHTLRRNRLVTNTREALLNTGRELLKAPVDNFSPAYQHVVFVQNPVPPFQRCICGVTLIRCAIQPPPPCPSQSANVIPNKCRTLPYNNVAKQ